MSTHAKVFACGEKYGVTGLKELSQAYFKIHLDPRKAQAPDMAEAIRIVYNTTPDSARGLRDILVESLLHDEDGLITDPRIEAAVGSVDKLAYELFKWIHFKSRVERCRIGFRARPEVCPKCSAFRVKTRGKIPFEVCQCFPAKMGIDRGTCQC